MSELETSQQELEAIIEQLRANFNPLDFMPPSQREIAKLTREELAAEYDLVKAKQSKRSAMQRTMIVYLFETQTAEQDGSTK
jgi:hypothetical protein